MNKGKERVLLLGTYTPKIDDKGRLSLPSKFRSSFSSGVIISQGIDTPCLYVSTPKEFANIQEKLRTATNEDGSKISALQISQALRLLTAGASEDTLDKQGRINIPPFLRSFADLKDDIIVIGVGSRVEIWNQEKWAEYNKQALSGLQKTAQEVLLF
ncbi:MAG: division/cell wall cluster transcriptional repressor MraZ [Candidatus Ancillula sp.]|jgi:MraZ protein|nr:division/cell wall cluster transcriptional repressor MraZ [Candidatus Ancillula sp.]